VIEYLPSVLLWLWKSLWFTLYFTYHWRRLGASFGERGRRISAEIFLPSPQMRNLGGRRGTHCLLETNVGSQYYHVLTLYIVPYILPFNAWFVPIFGWVRLNIEINHIDIEPQVQIKAKSIIQFDNSMNFVLKMDFDSFKPEFQYFDIYPHHFWLAACYSIHFQAWSVMSLMCVCHYKWQPSFYHYK